MGYNPSLKEKKEAQETFVLIKEKLQELDDAKQARDVMKKHPNYQDVEPKVGEGLCFYTLRYAANLISPPQHDGESYDVECTTIKGALLTLEKEILKKWKHFNGIK